VGGTTRWGWSVPLPASSPALERLASERGVGRVGGALDNLPLRAGLTTATPYTGFPLPSPDPLLKTADDRRAIDDPDARRWLRRFGVTHVVWDTPIAARAGAVIFRGADPALDVLAYHEPSLPKHREWRVVRLKNVFPHARVALRAVEAADRADLVDSLTHRDAQDEAWFLPGEVPVESGSARAKSARVLRWDGLSGEVEHDGACDLILTRVNYPGWLAMVDDGPERPPGKADGGLIAVRLGGAGVSRVALRYSQNGFGVAAVVSVASIAIALGFVFRSIVKRSPPAEGSDGPPADR
jgi:hypothetical protein